MAGFEVIMNGRFWASAEGCATRFVDLKAREIPSARFDQVICSTRVLLLITPSEVLVLRSGQSWIKDLTQPSWESLRSETNAS